MMGASAKNWKNYVNGNILSRYTYFVFFSSLQSIGLLCMYVQANGMLDSARSAQWMPSMQQVTYGPWHVLVLVFITSTICTRISVYLIEKKL